LNILCVNVGGESLFIPSPSSHEHGLTIQNGDQAFQAAFDEPFPESGLAPGEAAKIDVSYSPERPGADADALVIASNDPLYPETLVALSGRGNLLPDCDFTVNPPSLAFGQVDKGSDAALPFDVVNDGTDECLVNQFQIEGLDPGGGSGTPSAFSLPDYPAGASPSVIIPGGGTLEVEVRFAPRRDGITVSGAITFTISSASRPHQRVPITGSSPAGCLLVVPSPVDFGTVSFGASSKSATISIDCDSGDMMLNSMSLIDSKTPPEFSIESDPTPVSIPTVSCDSPPCFLPNPITFGVSFTPYALGRDTGTLTIHGDAEDIVVTLAGDAE
jgi:hypothetical protein